MTEIPKEMWEHPKQPKDQRPHLCLQTGDWPCVYPYCWCEPPIVKENKEV